MNEPKTFEEAIDVVCAELREQLIRKGKDYGKNNILWGGETGVCIRLGDKISRMRTHYVEQKKLTNESIDDTWNDLTAYGIIGMLLRRSQSIDPGKDSKSWFELPFKD